MYLHAHTQGSPKEWAPCLMNSVIDVAYHFNLPENSLNLRPTFFATTLRMISIWFSGYTHLFIHLPLGDAVLLRNFLALWDLLDVDLVPRALVAPELVCVLGLHLGLGAADLHHTRLAVCIGKGGK